MSREVRMVPPNWEHPETEDNYGRMRPQPMYDERFEDAKKEWIEGLMQWEAEGKSATEGREFWDDNNPPDKAYYRPWRDEEATWFQVWQTVSEGTPVTPPFATKEELVAYLAERGDFWDQKRCLDGWQVTSGWGQERAAAFVNAGWAPTAVTIDGKFMDGKLAVGT